MNKKGWKPWRVWVLRLLLGATFVVAAWPKLFDPAGFAKILYGYGVFPGILINPIAIVLPYVEMMAGICLVIGILPRSSLLILNLLLMGFILLISFNLARGWEFDCGCFSVNARNTASSARWLLVRDFCLLGVGFYLWGCLKKKESRFFTSS